MHNTIFETLEFDKILSHLASHTISPLGEEYVASIQPLKKISLIKHHLTQITEMRGIIDFDDPFPLHGLIDIRTSLKKAALVGNYLPVEELIHVQMTLSVIRKLNDYFKQRPEKYPLLSQLAANLLNYSKIEKEINRCIDVNTTDVFDHATPNLARIRKSIKTAQQRIRKKMDNLVMSLSQRKYLQENVITIRDGRLVLMVKDEHKNQVKGFIHDQSATGATLFIEPMETLELNNQVRALLLEEKREIEKILIHLTDLIREELDNIKRNLSAVAQLDFIYAKAQFSSRLDGYQPQLNDNNRLEIINGRHPLLLLKHGRKDKVVPLNLKMGDDFNTLIITGPNAGGKTVALKTVGLLCLMIQCGLHVPVDVDSNISTFTNIYSVIGDQQSIENDLSTFSSHIQKLKFIIDSASKSDLVIIDEIGSGTDPEEGAALAIAILEKMTNTGCLSLISTHQGALKAFAYETPRVENGSMEFNAKTLQPTYRFRLGLPGSSYAFDIAQRWGLSEHIIHRSRELVGVEKNKLENLLVELEKNLTEYQTRLEQVKQQQLQLDNITAGYHEKRKFLIENERQLKKAAITETEEILRSANAAVELAIKEIKEKQAAREAIKEAKELLEKERLKLQAQKKRVEPKVPVTTESYGPLGKVAIGKQVLWKDFNTVGTILSETDASKRVLIDTGEVKIRVSVDELQEISIKGQPKSQVRINYDWKSNAHSEIDLRGLRVDDAVKETDKFIEEALLAGLETVYIIHGKGSGALRNSINDFLKQHPHVKNQQLADWNQGGTGVTVVRLK